MESSLHISPLFTIHSSSNTSPLPTAEPRTSGFVRILLFRDICVVGVGVQLRATACCVSSNPKPLRHLRGAIHASSTPSACLSLRLSQCLLAGFDEVGSLGEGSGMGGDDVGGADEVVLGGGDRGVMGGGGVLMRMKSMGSEMGC